MKGVAYPWQFLFLLGRHLQLHSRACDEGTQV